MDAPLNKVKEVVLIERMSKRLKAHDRSVIASIGDDAAVVRGTKGRYFLYTVDMLIEGVHFRRGESYKKVGYKAMAVSVSDIAAMGGEPKYALVSVGLPAKNAESIANKLFEGITYCAHKFNIDVIGGDTNRSDRLVIDSFLVGEVEEDKLVLRSTAHPGDHIFVSGPLGGSLSRKHLVFEPRLKEARFLVKNFKVTSMIDLSDGLGLDLNRLGSASRLGALIFDSKIPRAKGVSKIENALFDGEDFELLFTLSPQDSFKLLSMMNKKKIGMPFYPIGRMTDLFSGVRMMTRQGEVEEVGCDGFKHF
jgi:thiamine-monophosphate kinase